MTDHTTDAGPSEDQVLDWNIHNDHAGDCDCDEPGGADTAGQPGGILGDLCEHAATLIGVAAAGQDLDAQWHQEARDWSAGWHLLLAGTDPGRDAAKAEAEPWKTAKEQLGELRRAVAAFSTYLETHPRLTDGDLNLDEADLPALTQAVAIGDFAAGCAAAVDAMCSAGQLPPDWAVPFWQRRIHAAVATVESADASAAALAVRPAPAGWAAAAGLPEKVLGPARVELMGHRVRVGVVSETTLLGQLMLRIDFPQDDQNAAPEFYQPSALYGITPGAGHDGDGDVWGLS